MRLDLGVPDKGLCSLLETAFVTAPADRPPHGTNTFVKLLDYAESDFTPVDQRHLEHLGRPS